MSKVRELNLVPQHIKNKRENREKLNKIIAGGIIVCCTFSGIMVYLNIKEAKLEDKKIALEQELQKTQERYNQNKELTTIIRDLELKISKVNSLSILKNKDTKSVITNLSAQFPKGLELESFNLTTSEEDIKEGYSGTITMKGKSKNRSDIEEFWANLREDKRYYISHVSGITKTENKEANTDEYSFDMSLKVKEK